MQNYDPSCGPLWTILKTLQWTSDYFKEKNIENPRASAEILLAHTLKLQRIDLYLRYDQPLQAEELSQFKNLIKRRILHEPVAYITSKKEFWSLEFRVTTDVLIPRPETECLVESALRYLKTDKLSVPLRILELGTGSGAIIISLAHEKPDSLFWALDLSLQAVKIARGNARNLLKEGSICFFVGGWFDAINAGKNTFDLIVSNPPYIRDADIGTLAPEIRDYEPIQALAGGNDGLRDISQIIETAPDYLKNEGILIVEIGYDQHQDIIQLAQRIEQYFPVEFGKDYNGHYRVAILRKK